MSRPQTSTAPAAGQVIETPVHRWSTLNLATAELLRRADALHRAMGKVYVSTCNLQEPSTDVVDDLRDQLTELEVSAGALLGRLDAVTGGGH